MSTLANIDDVKRVMNLAETDDDGSKDAAISGSLDAAESWFLRRSRGQFVATGTSATATFHAVTNDAVLHLPVPGSTITAVRVGSANYLRTLDPLEYMVMDDERVRLRSGFYWPYGQYDDLRGHGVESVERVEVDYEPPAEVAAAVVDGIAHLAASLVLSGGGLDGLQGLTEEKMGDYLYRINALQSTDPTPASHWCDGLKLLRSWTRPHVSVV